MLEKVAARTACRRGHPYSQFQSSITPARQCKECNRLNAKARYKPRGTA
jgi:hypothetical protein